MRDTLLASGLFLGLFACLEIWYHFGRRARARRSEHADQLLNIQGATLGLLALLLGFSFALAAGRFSSREQLIVEEANAIGTAWLRCDLLPGPQREEVRNLLRRYVAGRIESDAPASDAAGPAVANETATLQAGIWKTVSEAAANTPALANVLLPPFNDMFDLQGERAAAAQRRMPAMLLALLFACSLVSVAATGYGCGVAGKRNIVLTTALTFLISGTLWAIIDMDHPAKGFIRVSQQPMLDLQQSLRQTPALAR